MYNVSTDNTSIVLEASLLKILSSKDNYFHYIDLIDSKRLLSNTSLLLRDYKRYYETYSDHSTIDFGLFFSQFAQNWHIKDLSAVDIEYYKDYVFPAIENANSVETESCLIGLLKQNTLNKLLEVKDELNVTKIRDIIDEFEEKTANILKPIDNEIAKIDTVDFTELDKANGIPYFLPTLQSSLGSLVKGQFIVVSADYGAGKSAFVISQAVATLKHLAQTNDPRPILYFNSEGTTADIFGRVCSNLYSDDVPEGFEGIIKNSEKIKRKFLQSYSSEQFLVLQMLSSNVDWVQNKIKKYNPALVIIDITDTLAPEEDVTNLKKVYDRLRLLSGTYCPIIGTTQSGDTSYQDPETKEIKSKRWLNDKALYGSKTGKGGAADTIITIGKDDVNKNLRYISTPKKKRGTPCNLTCELVDIYSLYKELAW